MQLHVTFLRLSTLLVPILSQSSSSISTSTSKFSYTISSALISPSGFADDITEWLDPAFTTSQSPNSKRRILESISVNGSIKGLVIAAKSWVHPDYAYHWTRDAALVYNCLAEIYDAFPDGYEQKDSIKTHFEEYVNNTKFEQEDPTAISGIGEPKFYLGNNSGYQGSWGRPQNDGPALRVSTLLEYAEYNENVEGLWDVVKTDLDYLIDNWQASNFDPWEEVNGTHFFNRFVQRKAFLDAADYAGNVLNDTDRSKFYGSIAWEIEKTLYDFYDYTNHFIKVSLEAGRNKTSNKDVSVILAINHGYRAPDAVFPPTDAYVLSTVYEVATSFIDVFPISEITENDAGGPLAPPTGRYPEDVYDGYDTSEGNPWFLSCAAFAEFFYTAGLMFQEEEKIVLSQVSMPFWRYFADVNPDMASLTGADFDDAVDRLYGWGDAFMRTIQNYGVGPDYSEQFNKYTGEQQGARQLTWSHASILTAAFARAKAHGNGAFIQELAVDSP